MRTFCNKNICCIQSKAANELCPKRGEEINYYTQVSQSGILTIPDPKPNIEEIFNVIHEIDINELSEILVKSPAGKKVLVGGIITLGIEYISETLTQKVHFAHWDVPFKDLVMNPDGTLLGLDFDLNDFVVHICVEDLVVMKEDSRNVRYEMTLLIWLQNKDS
ncbi:SPOCS domain-containing protein [Oceanirhabdus sp. W0125-5]|uniref:SPOCS domain-containing protein n=1 Tax=Oceanirhabdus sp. W0125-5 TaxID=2999116 RepID=UPI0022F2D721|nr:SPOCS domain-containing protein [Oceanirhabdus sp. W0125-5]WBW96630.1 DUF3794 domain-containing protein [Oceanirhabdus sp. W0125-5]